jgi:small subunit ribosomal protein S6
MRSDVSPESARKVASRIEEVTARQGGKLTLVETWGRRTLAYPVKKQRRGVYVYVKYIGEGGLVTELERNLRMLDEVLKYQTVLVRSGIELRDVAVNPEDVKFEDIEPPNEEDEEMSRERILGLEPPSPERPEPAAASRADEEEGDEASEDFEGVEAKETEE